MIPLETGESQCKEEKAERMRKIRDETQATSRTDILQWNIYWGEWNWFFVEYLLSRESGVGFLRTTERKTLFIDRQGHTHTHICGCVRLCVCGAANDRETWSMLEPSVFPYVMNIDRMNRHRAHTVREGWDQLTVMCINAIWMWMFNENFAFHARAFALMLCSMRHFSIPC